MSLSPSYTPNRKIPPIMTIRARARFNRCLHITIVKRSNPSVNTIIRRSRGRPPVKVGGVVDIGKRMIIREIWGTSLGRVNKGCQFLYRGSSSSFTLSHLFIKAVSESLSPVSVFVNRRLLPHKSCLIIQDGLIVKVV